jgi:hypothetical protein
MVSIRNKKVWAMALGLVIMFAAVTPADAQFRRWRDRDRGRLSTGEKAAIIGGGAAAGAVLGGLLGGKKGAIIGGVIGGGGGTGYVVLRDRRDRDRWEDEYRWRRDRRFFDRRFDRRWRNFRR